jgi:hypothetical protein
LPEESATLGLPVAAPSGTLAVTSRELVDIGSALTRPPPSAVKRTSVMPPRWRPLALTFEPSVALWTPAQSVAQVTSLSDGGLGGVIPPPPAAATPAPADMQLTATATGIAVRHPCRFGGLVLGVKPCASLSSGLRG